MAAYDIENLMSDIELIMTSNLNTKIGDINTEKGDSITLLTIDSGAYFFQDLDHKSANYNPFILYSIDDINVSGIGPQNNQELLISIVLILADQSGLTDLSSRMLRYQRALKEIFEENFSIKSNANLLSISLLTPISLTSLNESNEYRAIGIQINTNIG